MMHRLAMAEYQVGCVLGSVNIYTFHAHMLHYNDSVGAELTMWRSR